MSTITITGSQFRDLVAPVMPFAAAGKFTMPLLEAVHVVSRGGYLLATATDHYRVGVKRVKSDATGIDVVIPIASLKSILGTFKPTRKLDPELTLTFDGDTVRVTAGSIGVDIANAAISYRTLDAKYPKIGRVVVKANAERTESPANHTLNPNLLADFAKVRRDAEPMRITTNAANEPVGIAIGDDFRGAIMTVRWADDQNGCLDGWTELLTEPVTPDKKPAAKRAARKAVSA